MPLTKWDSTDDEWSREPKGGFKESIEHRLPWPDLHPTRRASRVLELMNTVRRSLSIAELEDDWDGEGSPGYSIETLDRALEFVMGTIGTTSPPPQINPGNAGSIDLYWENANRYLLINFPVGQGEPSYYGEDRYGSTTGGVIKSNSMGRQVAAWLAQAGH